MRALCGAIITAGAVIGLGLTALGIGTRYQNDHVPRDPTSTTTVVEPYLVHVTSMDRPLLYCLVLLSCVTVIGLGIAFVGLAYHHHRRYHEMVAAGHLPGRHHHTSTSGTAPPPSSPPL